MISVFTINCLIDCCRVQEATATSSTLSNDAGQSQLERTLLLTSVRDVKTLVRTSSSVNSYIVHLSATSEISFELFMTGNIVKFQDILFPIANFD